MFYLILALFFLSALLSYMYIFYAHRKNLLDIPNQRSSHSQMTPRGGGFVFIGLWLLTTIVLITTGFLPPTQTFSLVLGTMIVAGVAYWDDHQSLSAKTRVIAYFLAAFIVVINLGGVDHLIVGQNLVLPLGWLGSILSVLAIVWSTNLFNFMDGMDGIAATESLFVLGVGGFLLWHSNGKDLALLSWLLAIGVAGFLVWNKPPAKLFMGDVGSASLGFIIMVLALEGEKRYGVPLLLWLILYSAFLFDATFTLTRRILAKQRWYEAHCLHAYQRLHQSGWTHGQVLSGLVVVNLVLSFVAVGCFYWRPLMLGGLLMALLLLGYFYVRIEGRRPMFIWRKQ